MDKKKAKELKIDELVLKKGKSGNAERDENVINSSIIQRNKKSSEESKNDKESQKPAISASGRKALVERSQTNIKSKTGKLIDKHKLSEKPLFRAQKVKNIESYMPKKLDNSDSSSKNNKNLGRNAQNNSPIKIEKTVIPNKLKFFYIFLIFVLISVISTYITYLIFNKNSKDFFYIQISTFLSFILSSFEFIKHKIAELIISFFANIFESFLAAFSEKKSKEYPPIFFSKIDFSDSSYDSNETIKNENKKVLNETIENKNLTISSQNLGRNITHSIKNEENILRINTRGELVGQNQSYQNNGQFLYEFLDTNKSCPNVNYFKKNEIHVQKITDPTKHGENLIYTDKSIYNNKTSDTFMIFGYSFTTILLIILVTLILSFTLYNIYLLIINYEETKFKIQTKYYKFLNFMMNLFEKMPLLNIRFSGRYYIMLKNIEVLN